MIITILVATLILLLFAYLHHEQLYKWNEKRRKLWDCGQKIFGRRALPVLGNLHQLPRTSYGFTEYLIAEANRAIESGSNFYRWWVTGELTVMPCNGETLKVLLESTTEIKKGRDYEFYEQWLGNGLLLSHDEPWKVQRKLLTPIFHFSMLEEYSKVFNRQAKVMIDQLNDVLARQNCPADELIDVYQPLLNCTLDIIGEAAMGVQIGAQQHAVNAYRSAVHRFNELAYTISITPPYWIKVIWYLFGNGRETDRVVRELKELSNKVIRERSAQLKAKSEKSMDGRVESKHSDVAVVTQALDEEINGNPQKRRTRAFLDLLLEMHESGELSLEQVREQVDTFIFAGHDTVAHALSWTIWSIATHPDVQTHLNNELCEHFGDYKEGDEAREYSSEELGKLHYLDACIKESLRIFPPVPVIERILRNDLQMGDKLIPAGTLIFISPLAIHHNAKVWGNTHDDYNPNNFYMNDATAPESHCPYDFIPFSAGPRNCIGQKFAMLELRTVLVHVLRCFELATSYAFHENARMSETIKPKTRCTRQTYSSPLIKP